MKGSVEALEGIINDAEPTTRCARVGRIGQPGEGSKAPPGPCEDGCPARVLRALTIPNLRAWKGCYDARGEKNLFIPCWFPERTGWYKRALDEQAVDLLLLEGYG